MGGIRMTEFSDSLVALGIPEPSAIVLECIWKNPNIQQPRIQEWTGLKQPAVSVAITFLMERNWVTFDAQKTGRGRPVHLYNLTGTISGIIDSMEAEVNGRITHLRTNLNLLRDVLQA